MDVVFYFEDLGMVQPFRLKALTGALSHLPLKEKEFFVTDVLNIICGFNQRILLLFEGGVSSIPE